MTDQHVLMVTRYGRQPAFAACPSAPGQYPGIIIYMDAPGFRDELCDMARRIANRGYFCLVPDLYYRLGSVRFDVARRNDAMSAVIRAAMQSLTIEAVMQDTAGMIAFLDAQEKHKPGPIGCVGHCMSGPFAVSAAARYTRMQAAAALYGVDMVTEREDSPHACLDRVRGELYVGFAEVDPAVPETVVPRFRQALAEAGTKHVLETVPGTHHGYMFPARPDYNAVAAEDTWERLFDLWQRNLG